MVNIKEKIQQGWLHIHMIQELAGVPKQHVEDMMDVFNGQLAEMKGVEVLDRQVHPAEKVTGGIWSMFAELEILVKKISTVFTIIYNFTPSSIEIVDCKEPIQENKAEITNILNDLMAKIHSLDKTNRQLFIANKHLQEKLKEKG